MSRVIRAVLILAGVAALAVGGGIVALLLTFPKVGPAPELAVATTPERLARGYYLAEYVSMCTDCHSERDWAFFSGPLKAGTKGKGGERFGHDMGLPGEFYAPNLTPAALRDWTDGEILQAMTAGVARDGRALFPIMPYPHFGRMARADAEAIVAYLRTLEPIESSVPAREIDFPMNLITRTLPADADFQQPPDPADEVAYGRYLTGIAACGECHTQKDHGEPVPGIDFAGGMAFPLPLGGTVRSANITPHAPNGIGGWSRDRFITRFKAWTGDPEPVAPGDFNTVMPWTRYAQMTERDLGAIHAYLRTVPAVDYTMVRFTPGD